jgi:ankyrin repeat protein
MDIHTKFMRAVIENKPDDVKTCLTQGADVNTSIEHGITALHICAIFNYVDVLKALLCDPTCNTRATMTMSKIDQIKSICDAFLEKTA